MIPVAAVLLFAVSAAYATGNKIKLTGVVTGTKVVTSSGGVSERETVISVRQASRKVGTLLIGSPSCGGGDCQQSGTANLKIGDVAGKARVNLKWNATGTGCIIDAPTCIPAKYGSGKISNASGTETIRVNTANLPTTKGSRFGIVLR